MQLCALFFSQGTLHVDALPGTVLEGVAASGLLQTWLCCKAQYLTRLTLMQ